MDGSATDGWRSGSLVALCVLFSACSQSAVHQVSPTVSSPSATASETLKPGWTEYQEPDLAGAQITRLANFKGELVALGSVKTPDGQGMPAAWTSGDARGWHPAASFPAASGDKVLGLLATSTQILAVGTGIWISGDGSTWERVAHPAAEVVLSSVTQTSAGYFAVGSITKANASASEGTVWTSTDGRDWRQLPDTPELRAMGEGLEDVIAYQGQLLAFAPGSFLSGKAAIWGSADGETWVKRADLSLISGRFALGQGELVIAGSKPEAGVVYLSPADGANGATALSLAHPGGAPARLARAAGQAAFYYTADGNAWRPASIVGKDILGQAVDILAVQAGFVAVGWGPDGTAASWKSADGRSWSAREPMAVSTAAGGAYCISREGTYLVALGLEGDTSVGWLASGAVLP